MSTPDPEPQPPVVESNPTPEGEPTLPGELCIVVGSRGSGKSCLGWSLVEKWHKSHLEKKIFFLGPSFPGKPKWVHVISKPEEIEAGGLALVDEASLPFGVRSIGPNTLLAQLIQLARHLDLTLIFISLNSANLDINLVRNCDILLVKTPSLLQRAFERSGLAKLVGQADEAFKAIPEDERNRFVFSVTKHGAKIVRNSLPSFWKPHMSKMYQYATNDAAVTEEAEKEQEGKRGEDDEEDEDEVEANPATEENASEAADAREEDVLVVNPAGKLLGKGDRIKIRNRIEIDDQSGLWKLGTTTRPEADRGGIAAGTLLFITSDQKKGEAMDRAGTRVPDRLVDLARTSDGPAHFLGVPLRLSNAVRVKSDETEAPKEAEPTKTPEDFDTVKNWERVMRTGDLYEDVRGHRFTAWRKAGGPEPDNGAWFYLSHEKGLQSRMGKTVPLKLISQAPRESTKLAVGDEVRMREGLLPEGLPTAPSLPQRSDAPHPTLSVSPQLLRAMFTTETVKVIRDWGDGIYEARRGTPPDAIEFSFSWFMAEKSSGKAPPAKGERAKPGTSGFTRADVLQHALRAGDEVQLYDERGPKLTVWEKIPSGKWWFLRTAGDMLVQVADSDMLRLVDASRSAEFEVGQLVRVRGTPPVPSVAGDFRLVDRRGQRAILPTAGPISVGLALIRYRGSEVRIKESVEPPGLYMVRPDNAPASEAGAWASWFMLDPVSERATPPAQFKVGDHVRVKAHIERYDSVMRSDGKQATHTSDESGIPIFVSGAIELAGELVVIQDVDVWGNPGVYTVHRPSESLTFTLGHAQLETSSESAPPSPEPESPPREKDEYRGMDIVQIKRGLDRKQLILDRAGRKITVRRKKGPGFYYQKVFDAADEGGSTAVVEQVDWRGYSGVYGLRTKMGRKWYILSFREIKLVGETIPSKPGETPPAPSEPEESPEAEPEADPSAVPPEAEPSPTLPMPEETPADIEEDEAPPGDEDTCAVDPKCSSKLKSIYETISEFFVWSRPFDRDVFISTFLMKNGSCILKGAPGSGKTSLVESALMFFANDINQRVPKVLYGQWGYPEFFQWMTKTGMYGVAVMNAEKTPQDVFFYTDVAIEKFQRQEKRENPPPPKYAEDFETDPSRLEVYKFDPRPREIVGARVKLFNEITRANVETMDSILRLMVERQVEFRGQVFNSPLESAADVGSTERTLEMLRKDEQFKDLSEEDLRKVAEHHPRTAWGINPAHRRSGQVVFFDYNPHQDLEGMEPDRALLDRIAVGIYLSAGDPGLRFSVLASKALAAKTGESTEPRERAWGRIRDGKMDPITSTELEQLWKHVGGIRVSEEVMAWISLLTNIPNMVIRRYQENAYFAVRDWKARLADLATDPITKRIDPSMMTFFPKAKEGAVSLRGSQTGLNPLGVIDGLNRSFGSRSAEWMLAVFRAYRYLKSVVQGEKPLTSIQIRNEEDRENVVKDLLRLLPYLLDHRINIGISSELQQSFLSTFDMLEHYLVPRILIPELTWNIQALDVRERAGLLRQMSGVMDIWRMMKSGDAAARTRVNTPAKRRELFISNYMKLRNNIRKDAAVVEIAEGLPAAGVGYFTYYMAAMAENLSDDVARLALPKAEQQADREKT